MEETVKLKQINRKETTDSTRHRCLGRSPYGDVVNMLGCLSVLASEEESPMMKVEQGEKHKN